MSYDELRHVADSWGLVVMAVVFLALVAWPFLPGSARGNDRAAASILEDEDSIDG
ncbi:cbb3-type cytochrome c oxidase subunit 3 [Sphingomonas sp. UNC305MFCol5.2]|uniref:cbb3-type cytochrome c oxidase subunit 3 n=1 Tax=Sphingomonas sp. UNC305MFCol5.2 TaxID=1449076 RepID=UPI0004A70998|nr:cbb3-type cytochrome c oxidase subunit 3 [Sphingomonas sp. UNC305MFCol5.2]